MLFLFNRMKGLINNMDAPVVPIRLDIKAPVNSKRTLARGVDFLSTFIKIPPEAINKEASKEINWIYSAKACTGLWTFPRTNK